MNLKRHQHPRRFGWCVPAVIYASLVLALFSPTGCAGPESTRAGAGTEQASAETNTKKMPVPDETRLQIPPLEIAGLSPAHPQPSTGSLTPGLAVEFFFSYFFRHLDPLTKNKIAVKKGRPGKPIPYLNHQFLKSNVFDSGTNRGVAMRISGLLRFTEYGHYTFRALSNDGLRVYISDRLIIDDPAQHSDQYAIQAVVDITESGWYPLKVEYFQRKGTAAIKLFWRRPGKDNFEPLPAEAFAHITGPVH